MEGSLWVYGQTRLADYYADRLTLRELANRFFALPPEAPVWDIVREEQERAKAARKADDIDDVLTRFKPRR